MLSATRSGALLVKPESGRRDVPYQLDFLRIVGLDLGALGGDGQHHGLTGGTKSQETCLSQITVSPG